MWQDERNPILNYEANVKEYKYAFRVANLSSAII